MEMQGMGYNLIFVVAVWQDIANRRQFFEKYAKTNGFDPLVPENWYYQSRRKILEAKVLVLPPLSSLSSLPSSPVLPLRSHI